MPTEPSKSGLSTSEGKLTLIAVIAGALLEGAVVPVLDMLRATNPDAAWIAVALGLSGALLQLASLLGYQRSRTAVKVAMLAQDAPAPVFHQAPVVSPGPGIDPAALVDALRAALAAGSGPTTATPEALPATPGHAPGYTPTT